MEKNRKYRLAFTRKEVIEKEICEWVNGSWINYQNANGSCINGVKISSEMVEWCDTFEDWGCGHNLDSVSDGHVFFYFLNKDDMSLFKLRWG